MKLYEDNERFFAGQQTNRNYAGPLDMPWLEEGMSIVQWRNGIISSPIDRPSLDERFYHPTLPANNFPECQCIWKIKALTPPPTNK